LFKFADHPFFSGTGMHFYQYNEKTFEIEEKEGTGLIPNIKFADHPFFSGK